MGQHDIIILKSFSYSQVKTTLAVNWNKIVVSKWNTESQIKARLYHKSGQMKENSDLAFITGWVSKNTLGNITLHETDFGAKRH